MISYTLSYSETLLISISRSENPFEYCLYFRTFQGSVGEASEDVTQVRDFLSQSFFLFFAKRFPNLVATVLLAPQCKRFYVLRLVIKISHFFKFRLCT